MESIPNGAILVNDSFEAINESSSFIHHDYSELRNEVFNESKALDFVSDKANIKKSWNGNSSILGVFEGVFFVPNGHSANKRFYPKELWDKVLADSLVRRRLEVGMTGTYEHPNNFDIQTEDGLPTMAHPKYLGIVTKELSYRQVNGKLVGWGKSYIMNTPIGNIINVMLKAKDDSGKPLTKLSVSSRAYALPLYKKDKNGKEIKSALTGEYIPEKTADGEIIVDKDNYHLLAFDVVTLPGFIEAAPEYKKPVYESVIQNYFNCNCESECRAAYIKQLGLKNIQ